VSEAEIWSGLEVNMDDKYIKIENITLPFQIPMIIAYYFLYPEPKTFITSEMVKASPCHGLWHTVQG